MASKLLIPLNERLITLGCYTTDRLKNHPQFERGQNPFVDPFCCSAYYADTLVSRRIFTCLLFFSKFFGILDANPWEELNGQNFILLFLGRSGDLTSSITLEFEETRSKPD